MNDQMTIKGTEEREKGVASVQSCSSFGKKNYVP